MKKTFLIIFHLIFLLFIFRTSSYAVYDPLSKPNNFFGIHVLFPEEIEEAAKLVNSNNGDWGYITIPIQANDRNLDKWQYFMDKAAEFHLIPILRIATKIEPIQKLSWKKPDDYDLVDFANFLNSLEWPTQNRYIIIFNEINRFDEWGGEYPDPIYYSQIIDSAYQIFKARNDKFFIIMGAFDNASITDKVKYMNEYEFMRKMVLYDANIFNKIDGFSSHSYPNPGFKDSPNTYKRQGVSTYKFEYDFINQYTNSKKPVFITETGWDSNSLGDEVVKNYFFYTFQSIWADDKDKIVAVTPFLLIAGQGQFNTFSFFKNGKPTAYYSLMFSLPKTKGAPLVEARSPEIKPLIEPKNVIFNNILQEKKGLEIQGIVRFYFKSILGIK